MDRYAVIGNPVEHSKSPLIHAEFARQTGQAMEYGRILAPIGGFEDSIEQFRAEGGRGVNVTVPFKEDAYQYATARTARAELAHAVNTLHFLPDGEVLGDTTDGLGLVRDITVNLGVDLTGKHILLMGAGGAARGVIQPLLDARPASLFVVNRTADKARALAPFGIRVCALNPVAGETPLLKSFMGQDTPEMRAKFLSTIPIGRFSTPEDLGNAACFLCSDEASMITGVAMEVDGGRCV